MATTRIEYIGPHRPGVTVMLPDGGNQEVAFGEPVELDSKLAKGLLASGDWREPRPGPKPTAKNEDDGA